MRANEFLTEKWSGKYKKSINCSHPRGFSQKAHCAGKKKHTESIDTEMVCEMCGLCETHCDNTNLDEACWKGYHRDGSKKMFGKTYPNCVKNKAKSEGYGDHPSQRVDPRTGKQYVPPKSPLGQGVAEDARIARKPGQPADSKKHSDLYTDENPRGTITGLKFATAEDARASVGKIRRASASHAHKIQAAVAMEQRARAAGKTESAAVYRRYINANKKTNEQQLDEKCWTGYVQKGTKKKGNRQVPNCVSVSEQRMKEDLRKWFKQKWVRFGPDGKIRGDCARDSESEGKPKCLPQAKAHALGKKGRASAGARKRRQDPDANRTGAAINVATKKK